MVPLESEAVGVEELIFLVKAAQIAEAFGIKSLLLS
jgi:hypothetical protein